MASPPDAGRSRHVGRIVDPLVRDDGQPEPQVELGADASAPTPQPAENGGDLPEPAAEQEPAQQQAAPEPEPEPPPVAEPELPAALIRGQALRERLVARAESAKRRTEAPSGLEEVGLEPPRDAGVVFGRAPSAPSGRSRRALSPDMIAVFGTLLGLATVASLIALVIHLELHATEAPDEPQAEAEPSAAPAPPEVPKRERKKIPGPWRIADAKAEGKGRIIEGKVGLLPFLRAVQDAGLPKKEAYRALTALKGVINLDKPNRSDTFVALLDDGKLKAFEYIVNKEEVYQAREGADGYLKGARLDLKVVREQVKGAFVYLGGSLDASAEKGGFEPGLARVLDKAVDGHMSLQELERGDMVRVIVQEVSVLGEFSRYAGVEAVEVRPVKGKPLRIYYFRGPSSRGYYDENGRSPYEGGWRKPIPDAPITSPFNPNRMHPVLKKVMPHTGTDFGAAAGTPIGASSYGTVSFIGPAGPSGNLVKVQHSGDIETGYAHMSRFAENLKVGDHVKRMQVVGYVGTTGRSTGPHLHFTVKKNGKFINPLSLNLDGMRVLTKSERDVFMPIKAKYDELLDAIPLPAALPVEAAVAEPASSEPEADEPDLGPSEGAAGTSPATQPAAAKPPEPAAPSAPAKKTNGNPVYLTDKELLELQNRSDDGEVSE